MSLQVVTVFETEDFFALGLAESSLEDGGIPYLVEVEDPQYLPGFHGTSRIGATPLWRCACRIQVTPEFEQRARTLLDPLRNPGVIGDTGSG